MKLNGFKFISKGFLSTAFVLIFTFTSSCKPQVFKPSSQSESTSETATPVTSVKLTLPDNLLYPITSSTPPAKQGNSVVLPISASGVPGLSLTCVYETVGLSASDPNYAAPGAQTSCANLKTIGLTNSVMVTKSGVFTSSGASGTISWTPTYSQKGTFRFIITASDGKSYTASGSIYVTVMENYSTPKLIGVFDPWAAEYGATSPITSIPSTPKITANSNNNTSSSFKSLVGSQVGNLTFGTSAPYQGTGQASVASLDPYSLGFASASSDSMSLGSLLNGSTQFAIQGWFKSGSPSTKDTTMASNGGGSGNGFVLRQSIAPANRVDFVLGKKTYSYRDLILSQKPFHYWKLDESSGTSAADLIPNPVTGTYSGGITFSQTGPISGDPATGVLFNGTNGYLSLPVTSSPTAYTVSMWIKPGNPNSNNQNIFVRTDASGANVSYSHQLYINPSGKFVHYYYDGAGKSVVGTTTATTGNWYHVAIVATNGGNAYLYVNGVSEGTPTAVSTLWTGGDRYHVGVSAATTMSYFNGTIDDIALFNSALTSSQIQDQYNIASVGIPYPGNAVLADNPIGYWRLNEKSGSTAYDLSGSGNNGTYIGNGILGQSGPGASVGDSSTAFKGDGSTSYIQLANSVQFDSGDFTIEAWFNTSANVAGTQHIWGSGYNASNHDIELGLAANRGYFYIRNSASTTGSFTTGGTYNDGNWHHIVVTRANSNFNFLVDGSSVNTFTLAGDVDVAGAPTVIGNGAAAVNTRWFNGKIAEVAIYNYALSQTQISTHYSQKSAWWFCQSQVLSSSSRWDLLTGLYNGTLSKLFMNGIEVCSVTPGTTYSSSTASTLVGATPTLTKFWQGILGYLSFYGTSDSTAPTTASAIKTSFDSTANRFRSTPIESYIIPGAVIHFDAANSNQGIAPTVDNTCLGASNAWFDLSEAPFHGLLTSFGNGTNCTASSGWIGNGTVANPYALSFDGTNDYVSLPPISTDFGANGMTIEVWASHATNATWSRFIDFSNGSASDNIVFARSGSSTKTNISIYTGSTNIADLAGTGDILVGANSWRHYAVTVTPIATPNQATAVIYTSGSPTGTGTVGKPQNVTRTKNYIGKSAWADPYFQGSIAILRVYAKPLSATEIKQNCLAQESRFTNTPQTLCPAP